MEETYEVMSDGTLSFVEENHNENQIINENAEVTLTQSGDGNRSSTFSPPLTPNITPRKKKIKK